MEHEAYIVSRTYIYIKYFNKHFYSRSEEMIFLSLILLSLSLINLALDPSILPSTEFEPSYNIENLEIVNDVASLIEALSFLPHNQQISIFLTTTPPDSCSYQPPPRSEPSLKKMFSSKGSRIIMGVAGAFVVATLLVIAVGYWICDRTRGFPYFLTRK